MIPKRHHNAPVLRVPESGGHWPPIEAGLLDAAVRGSIEHAQLRIVAGCHEPGRPSRQQRQGGEAIEVTLCDEGFRVQLHAFKDRAFLVELELQHGVGRGPQEERVVRQSEHRANSAFNRRQLKKSFED